MNHDHGTRPRMLTRAMSWLLIGLTSLVLLGAVSRPGEAADPKRKEVKAKKAIKWELPPPMTYETGEYHWSFWARAKDSHVTPEVTVPQHQGDRSGSISWNLDHDLEDERATGVAGGDPHPSAEARITFTVAEPVVDGDIHAEVETYAVSQLVDPHVDGTTENDHLHQSADALVEGSMRIESATATGSVIDADKNLRVVIDGQKVLRGQRKFGAKAYDKAKASWHDPVRIQLLEIESGRIVTETLYHVDLETDHNAQLTWDTVDGIVLDVPDRESSASLDGGFSSPWIVAATGEYFARLEDGAFTPGGILATLPWQLTYEGPDIVRAQLPAWAIPVIEATYRVPDSLLVPSNHYRESLIMESFGEVVVSCCQPVSPVDGRRDPVNLADQSVQSVETYFGDSNLGSVDLANGSELTVASAIFHQDTLHLFLGGNLESNYNKLEIFFDTGSGGQQRLRGDNADIDFDGLNRMGDDGSGNGLRFDAGFDADYLLTLSGGVSEGSYRLFASFAELPSGGGGTGGYLGWSAAGGDGALQGGTNPLGIRAAIDNSSVGGVIGGCGAGDPGSVGTGIEVALPLSALAYPTGCIRILAFINGAFHDYVSNQLLGALPPGTCNLGEPRLVDLEAIPGNQFFEVCTPVILAAEPPVASAPAMLRAWPNPFHDRVRLELGGREGRPTRLDVFDIAGRKVRSFPETRLGPTTVVWDGREDDGRTAPPGVYLVRARSDHGQQSTVLMRMR